MPNLKQVRLSKITCLNKPISDSDKVTIEKEKAGRGNMMIFEASKRF
jgi:hypothetical protein